MLTARKSQPEEDEEQGKDFFFSNINVVPLVKSDILARQVFYQFILALDMLSEGLAKLTLGRRDEFEAGKIKKNKLLRGIIIIIKKTSKVEC